MKMLRPIVIAALFLTGAANMAAEPGYGDCRKAALRYVEFVKDPSSFLYHNVYEYVLGIEQDFTCDYEANFTADDVRQAVESGADVKFPILLTYHDEKVHGIMNRTGKRTTNRIRREFTYTYLTKDLEVKENGDFYYLTFSMTDHDGNFVKSRPRVGKSINLYRYTLDQ